MARPSVVCPVCGRTGRVVGASFGRDEDGREKVDIEYDFPCGHSVPADLPKQAPNIKDKHTF